MKWLINLIRKLFGMASPQKAVINSTLKNDQILGVYEGSFTANFTSSPTITTLSINTGVADMVFYAGIYSVVGGTGFTNIGAPDSTLGVDASSGGLWAYSQSGNITLIYRNQNSPARTVNYKLAMFAKPSNIQVPVPSTNLPTAYNTTENYQKIAVDYYQPVSIPNSTSSFTTVTVPHNLGYIPTARAFIDDGTSLTDVMCDGGPSVVFLAAGLFEDLTCQPRLDSTNAYFDFTNITGGTLNYNLSCRIYYDPT